MNCLNCKYARWVDQEVGECTWEPIHLAKYMPKAANNCSVANAIIYKDPIYRAEPHYECPAFLA